MIALIWDMDDTLYNLMLPFQNACEAVLGITLRDPEAAYKRFRFRGDEVFEASQRGEMSLFDSRVYRFKKAMEDCGILVSEETAARFQEIYREQQMKISLSAEMKALLEECRDCGILMGMITNGPTAHQMDKVTALGLLRFLPREHIVISGEAGFMKPDVKIFRSAEERLGLTPEETFMIGDNYASDIGGAMDAGWRTIWFNRRGKTRPEGSRTPEYTVNTEEELAAAVRKLIHIKK